MNDYYYKVLISPWLPLVERKILQKNDVWLLGIKRTELTFKRYTLMADIGIHTGMPCGRYCICMYFPFNDRIDAYKRGLRCLPTVF